jgi:hypothetical protein
VGPALLYQAPLAPLSWRDSGPCRWAIPTAKGMIGELEFNTELTTLIPYEFADVLNQPSINRNYK